MIEHTRANQLLDLYGDLLSKRQKEVLELYFQEDFSLSEICENLSVSRSAVHDALHKGIDAMESFENRLHLQAKNEALADLALKHPELKDEIESLLY